MFDDPDYSQAVQRWAESMERRPCLRIGTTAYYQLADLIPPPETLHHGWWIEKIKLWRDDDLLGEYGRWIPFFDKPWSNDNEEPK